MKMLEVNEKTFHDSIRTEGLTLVDFGATWCPPCKALKPILTQLGEEYGEKLTMLEVDCDDSPELAAQFGVMSMPTVIIFHHGKPVQKLIGLRPKAAYENLLNQYQ